MGDFIVLFTVPQGLTGTETEPESQIGSFRRVLDTAELSTDGKTRKTSCAFSLGLGMPKANHPPQPPPSAFLKPFLLILSNAAPCLHIHSAADGHEHTFTLVAHVVSGNRCRSLPARLSLSSSALASEAVRHCSRLSPLHLEADRNIRARGSRTARWLRPEEEQWSSKWEGGDDARGSPLPPHRSPSVFFVVYFWLSFSPPFTQDWI